MGRSLGNLWTIFKNEFRLYFVSPIFYLAGSGWLFFAGIFFTYWLWNFNGALNPFSSPPEPSMEYVMSPMAFLTIFIAPALTMRLLSEEIRTGTYELLMTAPVRDWEVVVGKWLAAWAVNTLFILITFLFAGLLIWRGSPDIGKMGAGYLGLWLVCGATLAIGVLASSLTQHQVVAFLIGMGALVFLWIAGIVGSIIPATRDIFEQLTMTGHYSGTMLSSGLVNLSDIAYFVGIMAISLFLATQILGSRRWQA